jgi:ATP-binding cassette, subfamily B (MDR/TAP), member 1
MFLLSLCGRGLNQAATNFYSFEQGRIAAYRLYEMISRSRSGDNEGGKTLVSVHGNIEFRNVYFSYPSRPEIPILSGFFLTIPARKTVALVGRNGSGKSSIIPLMERFYDPTLGICFCFSCLSDCYVSLSFEKKKLYFWYEKIVFSFQVRYSWMGKT